MHSERPPLPFEPRVNVGNSICKSSSYNFDIKRTHPSGMQCENNRIESQVQRASLVVRCEREASDAHSAAKLRRKRRLTSAERSASNYCEALFNKLQTYQRWKRLPARCDHSLSELIFTCMVTSGNARPDDVITGIKHRSKWCAWFCAEWIYRSNYRAYRSPLKRVRLYAWSAARLADTFMAPTAGNRFHVGLQSERWSSTGLLESLTTKDGN